jgi:hypothetical protein
MTIDKIINYQESKNMIDIWFNKIKDELKKLINYNIIKLIINKLIILL